MDLPLDILSLILASISDKQSLVVLLRTSRLFKTIAEPLLYRDITFSAGDQARAANFKQRIDEDPHLATYVTSLRARIPREIATILPKLVNLRRLSMNAGFGEGCHITFDDRFSAMTHLTHLRWSDNIDDVPAFRRFLETQSLLEHLQISIVGPELAQFTLQPDSLPRLHTLQSGVETAMAILPGRNIRHLELCHTHMLIGLPSTQSFQSVHSLFSYNGTAEPDTVAAIARYFPNLKYLCYNLEDYDVLFPLDDIVGFLRGFATCKLEYVAFEFLSDIIDLEQYKAITDRHYATCFEELPSLRALDIGIFDSSLAFRYFRYDPFPTEMVPPHPNFESWDLWWENRDLGALNKVNPMSLRPRNG